MSNIRELVIKGDEEKLVELVNEELKGGKSHNKIIDELTEGIREVGNLFQTEVYYLPEMILSANALKKAMEVVTPYLIGTDSDFKTAGKVLIATVKGDVHDIGKNIVSIMLQGSGFKVIDLGVDVSSEKIVNFINLENPDILALSTLLSVGISEMKKVINHLDSANLRDKVKIIIGGAPINESVVKEIGADGFGSNAVHAVDVSKELLSQE